MRAPTAGSMVIVSLVIAAGMFNMGRSWLDPHALGALLLGVALGIALWQSYLAWREKRASRSSPGLRGSRERS